MINVRNNINYSLPAEILPQIHSFLSFQDRAISESVCKIWKKTCGNLCWSEGYNGRFYSGNKLKSLSYFNNELAYLKEGHEIIQFKLRSLNDFRKVSLTFTICIVSFAIFFYCATANEDHPYLKTFRIFVSIILIVISLSGFLHLRKSGNTTSSLLSRLQEVRHRIIQMINSPNRYEHILEMRNVTRSNVLEYFRAI